MVITGKQERVFSSTMVILYAKSLIYTVTTSYTLGLSREKACLVSFPCKMITPGHKN